MEIDLALNNEVEDFKEDYESIYLEIIKEACKQLDIHDDLELSVIFVDDQRIHGLLHLLGYDHMNEEDEKVMFSRQKEILNALNIERK